ncbi:MAG: CRISPR-associated endonuclease Cas2 [Candidatus Bilamarchaeaceae archaeon]
MYVIVAYDVNVNRVNKVKAFFRRYLTWVQNSLLEGEITESQLLEMIKGIKDIMDDNCDSVVFYILQNNSLLRRECIGIKKGDPDQVVI